MQEKAARNRHNKPCFSKKSKIIQLKPKTSKRIAKLDLRLMAEKLVVGIVTSRLITPTANPDKLRQVP